MRGSWPLFGRASRLAEAEALLTAAPATGVFLAGAPGVGRSRVAREIVASAGRRGSRTASVLATASLRHVPLGAFAPLLPAGPRAGRSAAESLRWAGEALTVREGVGEGPLVVLVDDAHLLDDASATLAHHLAGTGAATLVVTVRTTEPPPDAVLALWKDELLARMDLAPLGPADIGALLEAVLDGPVDGAAVHRLVEACSGNLVELRELVEGAAAAGELRAERGLWRLPGALSLPPGMTDSLDRRLADLDPAQRLALDALACGRPLGVNLLESVAGPDAVAGLEKRGLVRTVVTGRRREARLVQPLHGPVLRSRATRAAAAAGQTARLATAQTAAGGRRREDALLTAEATMDAGDALPTELVASAAGVAVDGGDLALARRVIAAGADGGAVDLLAARLAVLEGRPEDAEQRFASVRVTDGCPVRRADLACQRAANLLYGLGRWADAAKVLDDAVAAHSGGADRDRIAVAHASIAALSGHPAEALAQVEPMQARSGHAGAVAAIALGFQGRFVEALAAADRAQAMEPGPEAAQVRARILVASGRCAEARDAAAAGYTHAVRSGSRADQAGFATELAAVLLAEGRARTAVRYALEAAILHREAGGRLPWAMSLLHLARTLALSGDAAGGRAALEEFGALNVSLGDSLVATAPHAEAWVAAAAGDAKSAQSTLRQAAKLAREGGNRAMELIALHDLARLGRPREAKAALGALAGDSADALAQARVTHVRALAAGDTVGLEVAGTAFEGMGLARVAAEAMAAASVRYRSHGDARRAAALDRRAASLLSRCEGSIPAMPSPRAGAALTARDLEVARLAAEGCSNREIAARLFVSVRTVEGQLLRVYAKLGVTRRRDLDAALASV